MDKTICANPCQSDDKNIRADSCALYVCQCFKIMRQSGVPTREAIEFFFRGLAKYRDSCEDPFLSVPTKEGEALDAAKSRLSSARILKEDYAARMSVFEHVWLPNLSRYLPPEFHDEFRRRLKAFMPPSPPEQAKADRAIRRLGEPNLRDPFFRVDKLLESETNRAVLAILLSSVASRLTAADGLTARGPRLQLVP